MTSKETIDLVTKQNQILQVNLEKHMDQVIGLQSTVISGRVDAKIDQKLGDMCGKMDTIIKADIKRNGIIGTIKTETTFWRWTQRNYRVVLPIVLLLLLLLIKGADRINLVKTVENQTGFVIEDETHSVERGSIE